MFKSIEPMYWMQNYNVDKCIYSFKIIDDNFEQDIMGLYNKENCIIRANDCAVVLTKCYSNRSLSVGPNIILLFNYFNRHYGYSFNNQKDLFTKSCPEYSEELEKYLLLL